MGYSVKRATWEIAYDHGIRRIEGNMGYAVWRATWDIA